MKQHTLEVSIAAYQENPWERLVTICPADLSPYPNRSMNVHQDELGCKAENKPNPVGKVHLEKCFRGKIAMFQAMAVSTRAALEMQR